MTSSHSTSQPDAPAASAPTDRRAPRDFQARSAFSKGWAAIGLTSEPGSNEHNIRCIAQAFRVLRSLDATAPLTIRDEELVNVGAVLDLHDRSIVPLVMRYFSLDKAAALTLLSRIHQAMVAEG